VSLPLPLLLLILATVAAVLTAAFDVGGSGGRLAKRARAMGQAGYASPARRDGRSLKRSGDTPLDALVRRILPKPAALRTRLEATGYPITFSHYGAVSAGLLVVVLVSALLLGVPATLAILEAAATAVWLPHATVGFLMARRRARFFKAFPEGIGLIVRGLRAGLPVTETIGVVGREIADPVGEEFRRVADQVRLGAPLEDALWQTARRIGLPEFNFLVISLSVQRETGGNLAETLENLETILRRRQQMRLKIRAMSSEATASALIIGALPFVMAVLMFMVSRDYILVLFTTPLGKLMMAAGMASMVVGGAVMRQMVRFEI
jgi:tight adherence protein B